MQYIGELYSIDSEYGQKKLKEYRNKACTYLMSISNKNEVIDPTFKGNLARFINHSCEPNCETQKWHVLSEVCVGIFTLRDIKEGEELTFNYGFDKFKTTFQKCLF
jgi:SET domain-containing protein